MVNRDILLAKFNHIQMNLNRLKEKQSLPLNDFLAQNDAQDIVLFNMQAAIQGCIDVASHIISDNNWGIPANFGNLFDILHEHQVITVETRDIMRSMAGLRNLIVHEYGTLDFRRIYELFTSRLTDFHTYLKEIAHYSKL